MRTQRHERHVRFVLLASIALVICCFLANTTTTRAEERLVIYEGSAVDPSLGDLDADGDLDIVTGNPRSWFENDGSGNFVEHTLDGVYGPTDIIDIDGDGDLDLIECSADYLDMTIYMWENDGSGSFTYRTFSYTDTRPQDDEFVVADFDNDGDADVFITHNQSYIYDGFPIPPLYFENTGNWSFIGHHLNYSSPFRPPACVADFDNDNYLDIAVCRNGNLTGGDSDYEIIIFENNGFPFFTERGIDVDSLLGGRGLDTGDFDSDGRVDIAYSGGPLWVGPQHTYLLQSTNINWNYSMDVVYDWGLGIVHSCDYNLDGYLDIVIGSDGWDDEWDIIIMLGDGNGVFPTIKDDFINYDGSPFAFASGDIDGDGDPDIVDILQYTPEPSLGWWENETIQPYVTITLEPHTIPTIIPWDGGTLSFNATAENALLQPRSCLASGRVVMPGGDIRTLWFRDVNFIPGVPNVVENIELYVPANAPAGDYIYRIVVGWENVPNSPIYYGSFDFVKEAAPVVDGDILTDQYYNLNAFTGQPFNPDDLISRLPENAFLAGLVDLGNDQGAPAGSASRDDPRLIHPDLTSKSGQTASPADSSRGDNSHPGFSETGLHVVTLRAYPNPFNAVSTITLNLPQPGDVAVSVYNTLGQEVALLNDATLPAGTHSFTLDASNMASGLYFVRATVQDTRLEVSSRATNRMDQIQKIVVMK